MSLCHNSKSSLYLYLLKFPQRHTVVTSQALDTCERPDQVRYSAMRRPEVEPATC